MRRVWLVPLSTILIGLSLAPAASADRVFPVRGAPAPGPARYDRIRVIEQGPRHARHVLVLVPGTSAGAAYFRPVARDIVKRLHGWRVWSVDRRENLLEDHSVLDETLAGTKTPQDLFRYYLRWLTDPSITMAYATWDFHGRAGARDLSGLVLIDGGTFGPPISRADAGQGLEDLKTGS